MSNQYENKRPEDSDLTITAEQFDTYKICMQMLQQLMEVRELLGETKEEVERLESLVAENGVGNGLPGKEYFSPAEVAEIVGKKPYTVREWCRKSRIRAEKCEVGRGSETHWKVHRDELERFMNHGLLPNPDSYRSGIRGESASQRKNNNQEKGGMQ